MSTLTLCQSNINLFVASKSHFIHTYINISYIWGEKRPLLSLERWRFVQPCIALQVMNSWGGGSWFKQSGSSRKELTLTALPKHYKVQNKVKPQHVLTGSVWGQQNTHLYQCNSSNERALMNVDHTNNSSYTWNKKSLFKWIKLKISSRKSMEYILGLISIK